MHALNDNTSINKSAEYAIKVTLTENYLFFLHFKLLLLFLLSISIIYLIIYELEYGAF